MNVLKVSTTTDPAATAGAIANGLRIDGAGEIQVIGPRGESSREGQPPRGATSQRAGWMCTVSPASPPFGSDGDEAEEERTGIHFRVCPRHDFRTSTTRTMAE
jgi:stage V sporulation protein SpoVS